MRFLHRTILSAYLLILIFFFVFLWSFPTVFGIKKIRKKIPRQNEYSKWIHHKNRRLRRSGNFFRFHSLQLYLTAIYSDFDVIFEPNNRSNEYVMKLEVLLVVCVCVCWRNERVQFISSVTRNYFPAEAVNLLQIEHIRSCIFCRRRLVVFKRNDIECMIVRIG